MCIVIFLAFGQSVVQRPEQELHRGRECILGNVRCKESWYLLDLQIMLAHLGPSTIRDADLHGESLEALFSSMLLLKWEMLACRSLSLLLHPR